MSAPNSAQPKACVKPFAKRLWLLFAQAVTVGCGFVLAYETLSNKAQQPAQNPDAIERIATGDLAAAANNFSAAVERAAPAVVNIFSRRVVPGEHAQELGSDWNNFPELHMTALGSGVIVAANGSVLTNYHVVEDATNLFVALTDGRRFEARLLGTDPETDLALLKIEAAESLPVIEIGQSENLQIGQAVLAIGNPFDVGQTVTYGIVSALGRHGFGLNNYEDFIQTDAAINQGNSGGALIDLSGALVGINSAIFSPDQSEGSVGIGFAIPASLVREVLPAMMAGRHIERGYLGFVPRQFSEELAQDLGLAVKSGVLVKEVIAESPAAQAGMRTFDIILSINGHPVKQANRMLREIAKLEPGRTVEVDVLRGTTRLKLNVRVSTRPVGSREREVLIPLPPEAPEDVGR